MCVYGCILYSICSMCEGGMDRVFLSFVCVQRTADTLNIFGLYNSYKLITFTMPTCAGNFSMENNSIYSLAHIHVGNKSHTPVLFAQSTKRCIQTHTHGIYIRWDVNHFVFFVNCPFEVCCLCFRMENLLSPSPMDQIQVRPIIEFA